ncbi:MAG: aspartate kinase [Gemmatimonadetes bacterium]|nr:aspartate kinase [Gemmatimonadota bacterium]
MKSDVPPRVVLKFGGTSVSSRRGWDTISDLVTARVEAGQRILIVHSALAGVTDLLDRLPDEALTGRHAAPLDRLSEQHFQLGADLGLDGPAVLGDEIAEIRKATDGVALLEEVTPRIRARILAFGERLSTRIGAAFLLSAHHRVEWLDAGSLLRAVQTGRQTGSSVWLSAECDSDLEPSVRTRLDALEGVGLTQGFTARTEKGEPVVLGRGGSDTAAAYLAGKWGADWLEIWSDVPGMFSADPRLVPTARLLRRLNYYEAQEITTTGSQVVHPRAIRALRDSGIPIELKSTMDRGSPNTMIESIGTTGPAQVKAISWKGKIVLVSMDTLGMWQEVGFLARAFAVFKDEGISIDLVSTSESNVTVSLDSKATLLDEEKLAAVRDGLSPLCRVQIIQPCAAVSLVGSRIREILHRMGPVMAAFEGHRIHLVSQAASDLNFTVVVDEEGVDRLVRRLHDLLIPQSTESDVFGPSWEELSTVGTG